MSFTNFQKPKQEIIGCINLKQSNNRIIQNQNKRGISATQIKLKRIKNTQKKKEPNSTLNNIITQVEKDEKILFQIKKTKNPIIQNSISNNIKNNNNNIKSHSYSPNRINTNIKLNNGLLPPKITNKKTLVLDLDETLVHSNFIPFNCPSDVIIKIELENIIHDIHVLVRPGVKEFLEKMSKKYEIVIFTASLSKYADPLLDIIDKQGFCPFRLFREHCTLINTSFVKDLKKLGRDLKDIVIVDNSPISYALNPENGIPILSWFDDKNDRELYNITPILEFLADVDDVREYIRKFVIENEINFKKVMNEISLLNNIIGEKYHNENVCQDIQQVNINIINNEITNIICNNNENVQMGNNENDNLKNGNSEIKKNNIQLKNNNNINNSSNNNINNNYSDDNIEKNSNKENNNKNIFNYNKKHNNSLRLYNPKNVKNNFQFSQTTTHNKNNFLNKYHIQNVNTMRPYNLSNINQNQNNQFILVDIDFTKTNKKKSQIKYSNYILKKSYKNNSNNFLHSTSTQEINKGIKKGNKTFLHIEPNYIKNHHVKSLSYNFNISNSRPKSTNKRLMNKEKKNLKDLKSELNEILQKKSNSKSSRPVDLKVGYKYNVQNSTNISNGFNNYNSKLLKDKFIKKY